MTQEELFDLPYGCTNGIARRPAVSADEPHDHHRLRGHSQTTLRYPHRNNFVVKPNNEYVRLGIWNADVIQNIVSVRGCWP